jgi:hypothetical protein
MKACILPSNTNKFVLLARCIFISLVWLYNAGYTTNVVTVTTTSVQRRNTCSSTTTAILHSSWSPSSMSTHAKLCYGMSPAQIAVLRKPSTLQMHQFVLHWRLLLPWGWGKRKTPTYLRLCIAMSTCCLRWRYQMEIRPRLCPKSQVVAVCQSECKLFANYWNINN